MSPLRRKFTGGGGVADHLLDLFSSDALAANYDFSTLLGAAGVQAGLGVSGGKLTVVDAAPTYVFGPKTSKVSAGADVTARMTYFSGTSGSGYFGFIFRIIDANNFLWTRLYSSGLALEINKMDAGVGSNLATFSSGAGAAAANQDYTLLTAVKGNDIQTLQFNGAWPRVTSPLQGLVKHTLAAGNATKFGSVSSRQYAYFVPGSLTNTIDELAFLAKAM